MKIKYIVALMTAIATAGGCTQDTGEQPEEAVPIRFAATIAPTDNGKTRAAGDWGERTTTLTQGTEFLNGEHVFVYIKENDVTHQSNIKWPIEYQVANDGDGDADDGDLNPVSDTTPFFFPVGVNTINIHAIHPSYTSGAGFTVQTDQTTEANYVASDLCYSKPMDYTRTGSGSDIDANGRRILWFKHLLSKIVVNLTLDANVPGATLPTSIKLHAKTSTAMSYPEANANGYTGCTPSDASNPGIITMKQEAIIPPQEIVAGASFLSFSVTGVGPMIYPIPAATTFESGKMYTYNIKVTDVGITVTSTIDDWGTKVANQTVLGKRTFRPPLAYIEGTTNLTASSSDIVNNKYVGTTHRMATTLSQASTAYFTGVTAMNTFKNRVTVVEPDGVSTGYYHLPTAKEWMSILPPDFTNSGTSGNYLNAQGFTISGSDNQRIQWGVGYNYNMEEPAAWGAKWDSSTSTYTYEVDRQFKNDYYCPSGVTIGYGLRFKELDGSNGQYTCAFRYEYQANYNSTGWPMLIVRMKYVGNNTGVTITTIKEEDYWTSYDYEAFLTGYGEFDSYNDYPAGPTGTRWNEKGYYWAATRNTGTYAAQYCIRFDNIDVQGNTFHTTYSMLSIPVRLFRDTD